MINKIAQDGISMKDIIMSIKNPSFVNLSKLAIDYSDATING